jgi:hypothetical protein
MKSYTTIETFETPTGSIAHIVKETEESPSLGDIVLVDGIERRVKGRLDYFGIFPVIWTGAMTLFPLGEQANPDREVFPLDSHS